MCRHPSVAGRPSGASIIPANPSARTGARNRAAGQTRGHRGIVMRAHTSGGPGPRTPRPRPASHARETKVCMDAFVSHRARPDETIACVHAIVSPEEHRMKTQEKPGETIACMDAIISLERDLGETIASMHAFVSPRDADETKVCVHAIVSVGSGLSETKASVHAFVSPPPRRQDRRHIAATAVATAAAPRTRRRGADVWAPRRLAPDAGSDRPAW